MEIEEHLMLAYITERHGIEYVLQALADILDKKAVYTAEKLQDAHQAIHLMALVGDLRTHAENFTWERPGP